MNGIIVLYLFISLGIATYVANDASKRNKDAVLWFVLTILFGIIALIVYNITITPSSTKHRSQNRRSNSREKHQSIGSTSGWDHALDRYNYADDPIIKVSDGVNEAKFIVTDDVISPQSKVYERKYGEDWLKDAMDYLNKEYREDTA